MKIALPIMYHLDYPPFADASLPSTVLAGSLASGCALIGDSLEDMEVQSKEGIVLAGCNGSLVLGHLDIRSLSPKHEEIHNMRISCRADKSSVVLGLSETWLDSSISDSEVTIPGYPVQRFQAGSKQERWWSFG